MMMDDGPEVFVAEKCVGRGILTTISNGSKSGLPQSRVMEVYEGRLIPG